MYGTQAFCTLFHGNTWFENDVKMYGTQALMMETEGLVSFENDVKMYGTQAYRKSKYQMVWFENEKVWFLSDVNINNVIKVKKVKTLCK